MAKVKDAMKAMESVMNDESIVRSDEIYKRELFILKLAELREKYHIRQTDIKGFSQPSISRIEGRNDIKLSTLIKYLTQMDLEMEIEVRPRHPKEGVPSEVMLIHTYPIRTSISI
ncbi:MAG: XRE family transcriptional regulator [Spirochaetia bacterium]